MRCKACDSELGKYEVIWRKDVQQYEDLCRKCRQSIAGLKYPMLEQHESAYVPNITYYDDNYEEDYDYDQE